jgi:HlyD family secretion protein
VTVARSHRLWWLLALIAIVAVAAYGALQLWQRNQDTRYIANGRLEAIEVQLASRLAGQLAEVTVEEGDAVAAGTVVARLDSRPLTAALAAAEAQLRQAEDQLQLARAQRQQRDSECAFAASQYRRMRTLRQQRYISEDQLEEARTRADTTAAGCRAAVAQEAAAAAAIDAAAAQRQQLQVDLEDLELRSPLAARVLYRLAEPGEVIPAGGRVLTLTSADNVYLTLFLPTAIAGELKLGQSVPIHLDARPDTAVPAQVSFVAPEAQFTPKTVETSAERAKLMFRIKLRVEPEFLRQNADWLKPGMPGVARFEPAAGPV